MLSKMYIDHVHSEDPLVEVTAAEATVHNNIDIKWVDSGYCWLFVRVLQRGSDPLSYQVD